MMRMNQRRLGRAASGSRGGDRFASGILGRAGQDSVGMEEQRDAIGFLASDGVLYCSRDCALKEGRSSGYEVDQDEYESLVESQALVAGGSCAGCGAEFAVSWPGREPN
jgi:hypothetical protein